MLLNGFVDMCVRMLTPVSVCLRYVCVCVNSLNFAALVLRRHTPKVKLPQTKNICTNRTCFFFLSLRISAIDNIRVVFTLAEMVKTYINRSNGKSTWGLSTSPKIHTTINCTNNNNKCLLNVNHLLEKRRVYNSQCRQFK